MHIVLENVYKIIDSVDLLLEQDYELPALILIYSGIDILSSFSVIEERDASRRDFIAWANKYMVPRLENVCSGEDLYGARCAVVHSLSAESELSRQGRAKVICYISDGRDYNEQLALFNQIKPIDKEIILLNITEFVLAFEEAFEAFILENRENFGFIENFDKRSRRMFFELMADD